jgi:hypothetical protein
MKMKTMFLAAAIVCALAACKKEEAPAADPAATPAATDAPAADPAATPSADPAATPADPAAAPTDPAAAPTAAAAPAADAAVTGVPECDDYLTKYMACINDKVPAAARASMQTSMDQMRDSWKTAAAAPGGKAALAQACKSASDAAKQSMKAFGCEM